MQKGKIVLKIALVGAGSSVGRYFISQEPNSFLGIYRSDKSLSQLCDQHTNINLLRARSDDDLLQIFKEVETVVCLINDTNPLTALKNLKKIIKLSNIAGVSQFIHLSSHSIYNGQSTAPKHLTSKGRIFKWNSYALGKQWQENFLLSAKELPRSTIILRPGLIWGPGMAWTNIIAKEVLTDNAWMINQNNYCNIVNINFLLHAVTYFSKTKPFGLHLINLSDNENLTWEDYYLRIAESLGVKLRFKILSDSECKAWKSNNGYLRSLFPIGIIWSVLPAPLKYFIKKIVTAIPSNSKIFSMSHNSHNFFLSKITREIVELKSTNFLPIKSSFDEELYRTYGRSQQDDLNQIAERFKKTHQFKI